MDTILCSVAASACFGAALVVTQFGLRHASPLAGATISVTCILAAWWPLSLFVLDWSEGRGVPLLVFLAAGLFYPAVVTLLTYEANRRFGPTATGTVSSTTPIFAVAAAIVFLGERLSGYVAAGALLIVAGLALLTWKAPAGPAPAGRLMLPLASAALRAAAQVLLKVGLLAWPSPFTAALLGYSMSGAVLWTASAAAPSRPLRGCTPAAIGWFAGVGAFNGSAVLLTCYALQSGEVIVVSPILATYPLFTLLLSAIFLKNEPLGRRTIAAVLVTVAGVMVIVAR